VLAGAIDAGAAPPRRRLSLRSARATAVLGYPVSADAAADALAAIAIAATADGDVVHVEAPSFRPDLEREEDLIEEIVRVHGYDRLPSTVPPSRRAGGEQDSYRIRRRLRELLVRAGLRDSASLTFASGAEVALFGGGDPVRVANPPSAEEPYLRTRLLPKLLDATSRNLRRGARSVALSEIGHVFRVGDPVVEREHLAFVLAGLAGDDLHAGDRVFDVADAKGIVELVLRESGIDPWVLEPGAERPFHPGRSGVVRVDDRRVGTLGELHPADAARLDLTGRVALAELDVTALEIASERSVSFRDVPRFPPVRRDLAFVLPIAVAAGDVRASLVDAGGPLLDRATLFDVFRGGAIAEDRKSLAFALEFRAPDRTLTDQEVEPVVAAIVERLASAYGAELRA
jgi:phenylalanyl-tRNA synthetase beta chain